MAGRSSRSCCAWLCGSVALVVQAGFADSVEAVDCVVKVHAHINGACVSQPFKLFHDVARPEVEDAQPEVVFFVGAVSSHAKIAGGFVVVFEQQRCLPRDDRA